MSKVWPGCWVCHILLLPVFVWHLIRLEATSNLQAHKFNVCGPSIELCGTPLTSIITNENNIEIQPNIHSHHLNILWNMDRHIYNFVRFLFVWTQIRFKFDQLGLADPDAPHGDNDQGVAGNEQQVDAEKQEVKDISHMAPLVLQLALLLQWGEVGTEVAQVLTDLLQFRQSGCTWQQSWDRSEWDNVTGIELSLRID